MANVASLCFYTAILFSSSPLEVNVILNLMGTNRDVNNVNQNVLLNVDSLVLTAHDLAVMKSTKVIQSFESGAAQLSTPVQLCCCYVALLHRIIAASSVIQGVFFNWYPP